VRYSFSSGDASAVSASPDLVGNQVGGTVASAAFTSIASAVIVPILLATVQGDDSMIVLPGLSVEESRYKGRDKCSEFVERDVAKKRELVTQVRERSYVKNP
jgi:hypothetical protein